LPVRSPLEGLRRQAVATSLRAPADLAGAIEALGFIQADPIRAPARAQDLILRHRVSGYRAGDLDRHYPDLPLEEDFLYAYGFMPRRNLPLLHPRPLKIEGMTQELLDFVKSRPVTHPKDLEAAFGKARAVNAWGGFSKATTQALQTLHFAGHLRVVRRQGGVRLYAAATPPEPVLAPQERARCLILLVVAVLAPISTVSLRSTIALMKRGAPGIDIWGDTVTKLLRDGELESVEIDAETYLSLAAAPRGEEVDLDCVRILAPFDPIVWDRRRFDHLWGWRYRFEAYVPAAQRQLGYYAMPLLWRDAVIGWSNGDERGGPTEKTTQFIAAAPKAKRFATALAKEFSEMDKFLTAK